MVMSDTAEWLRMYRFWDRGVLAVSGGLLEQPAGYLRAMEIIDGCQG